MTGPLESGRYIEGGCDLSLTPFGRMAFPGGRYVDATERFRVVSSAGVSGR